MNVCRTVVVCTYPQPAALGPGHTRVIGTVNCRSDLGNNKAYLQETASSICVTLAKWAVFGMPKHLMPWAWRHSWEKQEDNVKRDDWTLSINSILLISPTLTLCKRLHLKAAILLWLLFVDSWLWLTRGRYFKAALHCLPHWAGL